MIQLIATVTDDNNETILLEETYSHSDNDRALLNAIRAGVKLERLFKAGEVRLMENGFWIGLPREWN